MVESNNFTPTGHPRMADISGNTFGTREAKALARFRLSPDILSALVSGQLFNGDILSVASIGGVLGAKQASTIVALNQSPTVTDAQVEFQVDGQGSAIEITVTVKGSGHGDLEVQALAGACGAALTIYDLLKDVDRSLRIEDVHLIESRVLSTDVRDSAAEPDYMNVLRPIEEPVVPRLRVIRANDVLAAGWQLKTPKPKKPKPKPKIKLSAPRTKRKSKPGTKAKPRSKAKAKPRSKAKPGSKAKPKLRSKAKPKLRAKAKPKLRPKVKSKKT
jgi:cyclic pyranopterin monophosphate synthase